MLDVDTKEKNPIKKKSIPKNVPSTNSYILLIIIIIYILFEFIFLL